MKSDMMPSRRAVLAGLAAGVSLGRPVMGESLPTVAVTKDPSCGCCAKWVDHLRQAGFTVTVTEGPVNPVKARLGVPRDLASCHTAEVGGYVVEGHVPAGAIKRLLAETRVGAGEVDQLIQAQIEDGYRDFLARVAQARRMSPGRCIS